MSRFVEWWKGQTFNEKVTYALILALTIGILTRLDFIKKELADTVGGYIEKMK